MNFVIEINGFFNKTGEFLPKEIGCLCLESNIVSHWIVSSEFDFSLLSQKRQKENNLITKHTGIQWYDGDSTIRYVYANLRTFIRDAATIYTKGKTSKKFLETLLCRVVINTEDFQDCPILSNHPPADLVCLLHSSERCTNTLKNNRCSLSRAYILKKWILNELNIVNSTVRNSYLVEIPIQPENIGFANANSTHDLNNCFLYNEHDTNIQSATTYTAPYDRSIPRRQDSKSADETDSVSN